MFRTLLWESGPADVGPVLYKDKGNRRQGGGIGRDQPGPTRRRTREDGSMAGSISMRRQYEMIRHRHRHK